jgi:HK97 family phage major capsid protein
MTSDDLLPELMQMQDPGNHYIWQPNARDDVAGSLFGYPVIMSEKVPQGTILLVDWAHYVIGLGPDITLEKNNAPGWSRDVTSFRAIVRADGVGSWSAPHTAANGNVYSWAVVLD